MVTLTTLPIRLAKVVYPGGYQLVVGGRLALAVKDGDTLRPDLPVYGTSDFPVDFVKWSDGEHQEVCVSVTLKNGKFKPVSSVRAFMALFVASDADLVREWIRRNACSA